VTETHRSCSGRDGNERGNWRRAAGRKQDKEKSRVSREKGQDFRRTPDDPTASPMLKNIQPELTLEQLRALPSVEMDFTTPEGAILCLENACRRQNIESACICKNFLVEGILMLLDADPNLARNAELRKRNAVLLERQFRKEITESWPDLKGVESFFIDRQAYIRGIVAVTELRRLPDGSFNKLNLLVANTISGWRVLKEISDDELEG
jgi:hypothetical protein